MLQNHEMQKQACGKQQNGMIVGGVCTCRALQPCPVHQCRYAPQFLLLSSVGIALLNCLHGIEMTVLFQ